MRMLNQTCTCYSLPGMKDVGEGGHWRRRRKYYYVGTGRSIEKASENELEKDETRYIVMETIIIKVYCKLTFCL